MATRGVRVAFVDGKGWGISALREIRTYRNYKFLHTVVLVRVKLSGSNVIKVTTWVTVTQFYSPSTNAPRAVVQNFFMLFNFIC